MRRYQIIALSLLALPTIVWAQSDYYAPHMPMMGWGAGNSMMWGGWITTVLVWILLIVAILAILKWIDKNK